MGASALSEQPGNQVLVVTGPDGQKRVHDAYYPGTADEAL